MQTALNGAEHSAPTWAPVAPNLHAQIAYLEESTLRFWDSVQVVRREAADFAKFLASLVSKSLQIRCSRFVIFLVY